MANFPNFSADCLAVFAVRPSMLREPVPSTIARQDGQLSQLFRRSFGRLRRRLNAEGRQAAIAD